MQFRLSATDANNGGCGILIWESLDAHDDLDRRNLVATVLTEKLSLISHNLETLSCAYIDARELTLQAKTLRVNSWKVKDGERVNFVKVAEDEGVTGGWCVPHPIPPMPDNFERMGDEMKKAILQDHKWKEEIYHAGVPDVFVALGNKQEAFEKKVEGLTEKVITGSWKTWLAGKGEDYIL